VVVALVVSGVGACAKPGSDGSVSPNWHAYPGVFALNSDFNTGPLVLVPTAANCFVAFGRDSTGYGMVAASWVGVGDCTHAVSDVPTRTPAIGDGLPSQDRVAVIAAVPAAPNTYLTVTRRTYYGDAYGYSTTASIGAPGADVRVVARFAGPGRGSHNGPYTVVRLANGYAAAGYIEALPTVWTSADGTSWHAATLPDPGRRTLDVVGGPRIAAGPNGQLVVFGEHGTDFTSTTIDAWYSNDGGATWSLGATSLSSGPYQIRDVRYDGREYVAVGAMSLDAAAGALVLRSSDGRTWHRDTPVLPADPLALGPATVLPDGSLLAFAPTGASGPKQPHTDVACAAAWIETAGSWRREDIGCHGVPEAVAVLGDGRVVAARGDYLFLRGAATT
jgi:hypothetical protein